MKAAIRAMMAAFIAFFALLTNTTMAADYTVTVNGAPSEPLTAFMQGYLHGFLSTETLDATLVGTNLQPEFWRLGYGGWDKYPKVAPFGPQVTMVVSDLFADSKGGYANSKPWLNWTEWEQFCIAQVNQSISQGKPVAYWSGT